MHDDLVYWAITLGEVYRRARDGAFDVSATYQYSRVSAGDAGDALGSDRAKSHSLRATARIRFRN